jgi:hypothetical protein
MIQTSIVNTIAILPESPEYKMAISVESAARSLGYRQPAPEVVVANEVIGAVATGRPSLPSSHWIGKMGAAHGFNPGLEISLVVIPGT